MFDFFFLLLVGVFSVLPALSYAVLSRRESEGGVLICGRTR